MKKLILLMALAMIVGLPADAKRKKKKESKAEKKEAPVRQGLFSVQKDGDKWFFLVPDSLMGSPFLAITRYVSTPSGAGIYGGEEVNEQTFYWEKVDGRLLLRSLVYLSVADSTQAIARAVKASAQDPIVESFKIEATKKDSAGNQSYKVEIGRLFAKENVAVGLDANSKKRLGLTAMNSERSFIKAINTYPINTEIKTVRTYNSKEGGSIPAGQVAGAATFEMNTSFVQLPKVPMRKRLFDPRVGYFAYYYAPFDDGQQSVRNKEYISRWRLEPREEDIEKMKRGELVEPKKQIVYYIDPATPKQWRPYLIQGVNDWNAAFEQAGFKNAIVGKEWPEDSTMSMEDARFSVIRYLASPISNAYGPHVSDPRSGEILESHVGWYHNVMKLVHDWYMIQAGCADSTARKMKFDDELMGQLIRFVSSHEIGHTLGLRHNMGASHATPVDSLRNKEWVEKHGHTASIMDYARFNYVAQPEDNVGRDGLFPRINDYDKWAIEWGYKPLFGTADEEEDRLVLNKMIVEQLKKGPRYWFGGEGYDNDPRAQTEDLGDNAVRASEYGIMNLKRIVKALPDWTHEEADLGRNIKEMHSQVTNQFMRYEGHVLRNIGGIYTTYKSTEEPGPVYTPQTKAEQKAALDFIGRHAFTEPSWLVAESYMSRISQAPVELLYPIADRAVTDLLSPIKLRNIDRYSYAADAYLPGEYISDLAQMAFSETGSGAAVSPYRRHLQTQFVATAARHYDSSPISVRAYYHSLLLDVRRRLASARTADAATRAHYAVLRQMIDDAIERK